MSGTGSGGAGGAVVIPVMPTTVAGWITEFADATSTFSYSDCDTAGDFANFTGDDWEVVLVLYNTAIKQYAAAHSNAGFDKLSIANWRVLTLAFPTYVPFMQTNAYITELDGFVSEDWQKLIIKDKTLMAFVAKHQTVAVSYQSKIESKDWDIILKKYPDLMSYYLELHTHAMSGSQWVDLLLHDSVHTSTWQSEDGYKAMTPKDWDRLVKADPTFAISKYNSGVMEKYTSDDWVSALLADKHAFTECMGYQGFDPMTGDHWVTLLQGDSYYAQFADTEGGLPKLTTANWTLLLTDHPEYASLANKLHIWATFSNGDWATISAKQPQLLAYK